MEAISKKKDLIVEILNSVIKKRLIFIVDEAHESTFGDMLIAINVHLQMPFLDLPGLNKKENEKDEYYGNRFGRVARI